MLKEVTWITPIRRWNESSAEDEEITPTVFPMTEHSNDLVSYFRIVLTFQHEI